jgi:hypothetical protein
MPSQHQQSCPGVGHDVLVRQAASQRLRQGPGSLFSVFAGSAGLVLTGNLRFQ